MIHIATTFYPVPIVINIGDKGRQWQIVIIYFPVDTVDAKLIIEQVKNRRNVHGAQGISLPAGYSAIINTVHQLPFIISISRWLTRMSEDAVYQGLHRSGCVISVRNTIGLGQGGHHW